MHVDTVSCFLDNAGKQFSDLIEEVNIADTLSGSDGGRLLFVSEAQQALNNVKIMKGLKRVT